MLTQAKNESVIGMYGKERFYVFSTTNEWSRQSPWQEIFRFWLF